MKKKKELHLLKENKTKKYFRERLRVKLKQLSDLEDIIELWNNAI